MSSVELFNLGDALMEMEQETPDNKYINLASVIFESTTFCDLNIPEKQTLLDPWLKEQSIILLTGWRGTGKTWFSMGICNAITTGKSFGPWKTENIVPCLYLEGEMAATDIKDRILSLSNGEQKAPLYVYSDGYANSQGMPRASLLDQEWRTNIERFLVAKGIKFWVVDNLSSLSPGIDENSKQPWDEVNQWLLRLRFLGISTLLVHHTNKEGGQRGTSAREDNLDISLCLQRPMDYFPQDGARFVVKFTKTRIRTEDLPKIEDTEFQLKIGLNDVLTWSYKNVRGHNKVEILKMLDQGVSQKEIVETLGIDKGYVSRIKKQAIKDGYLSTKSKLTQSGFMYISTIQI